jgi:hypothetical protein
MKFSIINLLLLASSALGVAIPSIQVSNTASIEPLVARSELTKLAGDADTTKALRNAAGKRDEGYYSFYHVVPKGEKDTDGADFDKLTKDINGRHYALIRAHYSGGAKGDWTEVQQIELLFTNIPKKDGKGKEIVDGASIHERLVGDWKVRSGDRSNRIEFKGPVKKNKGKENLKALGKFLKISHEENGN